MKKIRGFLSFLFEFLWLRGIMYYYDREELSSVIRYDKEIKEVYIC